MKIIIEDGTITIENNQKPSPFGSEEQMRARLVSAVGRLLAETGRRDRNAFPPDVMDALESLRYAHKAYTHGGAKK